MSSPFWDALKRKTEGLIIGAVFGFLAAIAVSTQIYQGKDEQITLHKEQVIVKTTQIEYLQKQIKELKAERESNLKSALEQQKSLYDQNILFLTKQIEALSSDNVSIQKKYLSLLSDYKNLTESYDSDQVRTVLFDELTFEKDSLVDDIEHIHDEISDVNRDIGDNKVACQQYKKGENFHFVSELNCEDYETAIKQLETLNQKLIFKQEVLANINKALIELNGAK